MYIGVKRIFGLKLNVNFKPVIRTYIPQYADGYIGVNIKPKDIIYFSM